MGIGIDILPPGWDAGPPEPLRRPDLYAGITLKRVVAYLIDVVLIALIGMVAGTILFAANVLTLWLLHPLAILIMALIPLAYHTFQIGGPASATLGMRAMAIEVRRLDGGRPGLLQALIQTVMFYTLVSLTSWLILVVALFNPRRRTVHDFLAQTVVVNRLSQV